MKGRAVSYVVTITVQEDKLPFAETPTISTVSLYFRSPFHHRLKNNTPADSSNLIAK